MRNPTGHIRWKIGSRSRRLTGEASCMTFTPADAIDRARRASGTHALPALDPAWLRGSTRPSDSVTRAGCSLQQGSRELSRTATRAQQRSGPQRPKSDSGAGSRSAASGAVDGPQADLCGSNRAVRNSAGTRRWRRRPPLNSVHVASPISTSSLPLAGSAPSTRTPPAIAESMAGDDGNAAQITQLSQTSRQEWNRKVDVMT